MAYGQNNGFQKQAPKANVPAAHQNTAPAPAAQAAGGGAKPSNKLFTAFKNKGQGYSVMLKEDITIPAGTKIGVFQEMLKGKDGTEYDVLKITKLPARES